VTLVESSRYVLDETPYREQALHRPGGDAPSRLEVEENPGMQTKILRNSVSALLASTLDITDKT
jgi:hypothetical protein